MQRQGFSLLELSVVLAILAVILAFGIDIGQNAVKGSARVNMQEKMSILKQSLDNFAERNGYLPCPADPTMLPSNAAYGVERRAGLDCATYCTAGVCFGQVPTRNLGLDESYASDEWGNKITYAVSITMNGNMSDAYGGWNAYSQRNGGIQINSGTLAAPKVLSTLRTGSGSVQGAGATYVVVSHGRNGRGAFPVNATAATACSGPAGSIDVQNCDRSDVFFYDSAYNEGSQPTTAFDDYIVWGTNVTQMIPTNTLPNVCPSGVCEPWCAPCESPPTMTQAVRSAAPGAPSRLCAKFITRNLPACEARCIWQTLSQPCP